MSETPATGLYAALLAAQGAMGPVVKNATNPHLKVKYADLGAVLDTVLDPLRAHGVLLVQRFDATEWGAVLITELIHAATGEKLASVVPVASKDPTDPQKMGGAITYYRRYSLLALLGLAPEDDDGHSAAQPARPAKAPARAPAPPERAEAPATAPGGALTDAAVEAQILDGYQLLEDGCDRDRILDTIEADWEEMTDAQREQVKAAGKEISRKVRERDKALARRLVAVD